MFFLNEIIYLLKISVKFIYFSIIIESLENYCIFAVWN